MKKTMHITSGDAAGELIDKTGVAGEVFVWHDILYDGPRRPGWPDEPGLETRATFLEGVTGGGLHRDEILRVLRRQYQKLEAEAKSARIVLWFDACLFDQSMLAHILTCLDFLGIDETELLCIDSFPGIEPFNGLGQLTPEQMASLYHERRPVTADQWQFAAVVDRACAIQDIRLLRDLSENPESPLPWVSAAAKRWLQEQPDPETGLGRLEFLALQAIRNGCRNPLEVFSAVAAADSPPQYWGDITLWAKINGLADRNPQLVRIEGPAARLPQWEAGESLQKFRLTPLADTF